MPDEVVVDVPEVDLTDGAGGPVYVVQVAGSASECQMEVSECAVVGATWTDVCRVIAPPRSKRRTIITAAAHTFDGELPALVRVLDAEAAHEHRVGLKKRDPELVIG